MRNKHNSFVSDKNSSTVAPIIAFGLFAAMSMTGTPTLNNTSTNFVSSTPLFTTTAYKKDEEYCSYLIDDNYNIQVNGTSINTYSSYLASESPTSTLSIIDKIENKINDTFDQYFFSFINEVDRHPNYLSISKSQAMQSFVSSARKIAKIPYQKSSIDLLPEDGFKFVLKLSDSKILMASQYMVDTDIPSDNVVFSVFENRKLIESNILDIDSFVSYFTA